VIAVEVLKRRLENIPNKLDMDCGKWAELCRSVLPEFYGRTRKEPKPTKAQPGSAERVEIYIQREQNGESIFSEKDWVPTHRTL
jgi:hypothetical protein